MWEQLLSRLRRLKHFDRSFQIFGADYHRYHLQPTVRQQDIKSTEKRLKVQLPAELKSFYTQLGNGRAGPYLGMIEARDLRGYQPEKPYQGVDYFKQLAEEQGVPEDEDGYFEVPKEALQGLITIMHEGCGHEVCLVSAGDEIGKIVHISNDGFVEDSHETSLKNLYKSWLDQNILAFEHLEKLLHSDMSAEEIHQTLNYDLGRYDGRDLLISLLGLKKPKELFGTRSRRIYHKAGQQEWYDEQLTKYRSQNRETL